jgi:hypothetical protein
MTFRKQVCALELQENAISTERVLAIRTYRERACALASSQV